MAVDYYRALLSWVFILRLIQAYRYHFTWRLHHIGAQFFGFHSFRMSISKKIRTTIKQLQLKIIELSSLLWICWIQSDCCLGNKQLSRLTLCRVETPAWPMNWVHRWPPPPFHTSRATALPKEGNERETNEHKTVSGLRLADGQHTSHNSVLVIIQSLSMCLCWRVWPYTIYWIQVRSFFIVLPHAVSTARIAAKTDELVRVR